ncbi:hypothetical protein QWJ41_14825 [Nocardioides sp. SOB44]|uniref:Uncharacterized protein n=1 Tax=Nocardioides cremeus TaxID=3058044 RepID=A0ABT8TSS3_9ACTN|nr:hypothetical protein [Nocardioides cremeus]MDO3396998.1 hypothetical protein [Nocardioides cremeus]
MSQSLNPDLEGTPCSIATCLDVADVIGAATVRLPLLVGVPEGNRTLILETPLCVEHAHLLRMGVDSCAFDSRLT